MSAKRPVRCAIYTRKSTDEGLDQDFNSLDAQREACQAYVASQKSEGWIALLEHFDDGGYSGGTLERPALQQLLSNIESGGVDVAVVYKIDRLSRSLMDFAKLVEVFDRKAVTFVSVTQSFNTTTSMGRLTLNVLLSFAQFEREITGERIRDKFAASKKKGIWMGGTPPLGYDVRDRKLVVNWQEAETVRVIFQLYLDLGSARALCDALKTRRILSKTWTSRNGRHHPGMTFSRGALYHLLKNQIYAGRITHKDQVYPGEHEAIVPPSLFEAVQKKIEVSRQHELNRPRATHNALLTGILFDESGTPMTPSYSVNPLGHRYRYYLSRDSNQLRSISIKRIPALPIEQLVQHALRRLRLLERDHDEARSLRGIVERVDIGTRTVTLLMNSRFVLRSFRSSLPNSGDFTDAALLAHLRTFISAGEGLVEAGDHLQLTLPARARFRGGRASVLSPRGTHVPMPQQNLPLIKAIARAHLWKRMLLTGKAHSLKDVAAEAQLDRSDAGRIFALAFLSPSITRDILSGRQYFNLSLKQLIDISARVSWQDQHTAISLAASRASLSAHSAS